VQANSTTFLQPTALIGQMEANFAKQVRHELRNLLMCPARSGRVQLGIVDRSGAAGRDVWDRLLRDLPVHSEMREQVFLQFMFGNRLPSVPAPQILTRVLIGLRRLLSLETLLAVVCVIFAITFLLKATPNIDQLGGKWAEWGWLIALPSVPVWNAWRLTQSSDELTVEGVIFGVLVVIVIAIDGAVQYAWIILGLTIFLWLARWLRQRPLAVLPISLLAVIPVLLLMTVTVAVDPASVRSFLETIGNSLHLGYLIFILLGTLLAIRLAWQAFDRRLVLVAGVPTLSRYMTSPQQYRLGQFAFCIFASGFFLLLGYLPKEVIPVIVAFQGGLPELAPSESPSYLLTMAGCVVYLYLRTGIPC
jgi:hypothetical protein